MPFCKQARERNCRSLSIRLSAVQQRQCRWILSGCTIECRPDMTGTGGIQERGQRRTANTGATWFICLLTSTSRQSCIFVKKIYEQEREHCARIPISQTCWEWKWQKREREKKKKRNALTIIDKFHFSNKITIYLHSAARLSILYLNQSLGGAEMITNIFRRFARPRASSKTSSWRRAPETH